MKLSVRFGLAACASLMAAAACSSGVNGSSGGGDGPAGVAASPQQFCASLCNRMNGCDMSVDLETCTNQCMDETSTMVAKFRSDVVGQIETCFAKEDCATVLATGGISKCIDEAVASVAPTAEGMKFCDDWSNEAQTCGGSIDSGKCLDLAKVYTDSSLADADACTQKSCGEMVSCIYAALAVPTSTGAADAGYSDASWGG